MVSEGSPARATVTKLRDHRPTLLVRQQSKILVSVRYRSTRSDAKCRSSPWRHGHCRSTCAMLLLRAQTPDTHVLAGPLLSRIHPCSRKQHQASDCTPWTPITHVSFSAPINNHTPQIPDTHMHLSASINRYHATDSGYTHAFISINRSISRHRFREQLCERRYQSNRSSCPGEGKWGSWNPGLDFAPLRIQVSTILHKRRAITV